MSQSSGPVGWGAVKGSRVLFLRGVNLGSGFGSNRQDRCELELQLQRLHDRTISVVTGLRKRDWSFGNSGSWNWASKSGL